MFGATTAGILAFFTAFLILQARETIKGAEDVEGDEARDVRTIARIYGYNAAAGVAAGLNFIGVLSYVLIWVWGFASWDLWPLLILGAVVVLGAGSPASGGALFQKNSCFTSCETLYIMKQGSANSALS